MEDQLPIAPGETPEEYVARMIREIEITDNGEEEVVIHLQRA